MKIDDQDMTYLREMTIFFLSQKKTYLNTLNSDLGRIPQARFSLVFILSCCMK